MLQGNDHNFASEYFWNLKVDNYSIRIKLDCCPIPGLNFDQLASNLAPSPPGQRSPFYYSFMLAQDSPLFYFHFYSTSQRWAAAISLDMPVTVLWQISLRWLFRLCYVRNCGHFVFCLVFCFVSHLWFNDPFFALIQILNAWFKRQFARPEVMNNVLRSEVLRSLGHYLRSESRGHHTIDRLEERGVNDLPWKDERGPSSIRRTLELWGNFWETGRSAYRLFRAHIYTLN